MAQLLVVRRSDMPQFNIGTDPPSAPARGSRSSRQSNFKSVDEEQQGKMDVLENEEV